MKKNDNLLTVGVETEGYSAGLSKTKVDSFRGRQCLGGA